MKLPSYINLVLLIFIRKAIRFTSKIKPGYNSDGYGSYDL